MRALISCMLVILCSHSLSGCLRTSGEVSNSPLPEPDQGLPELDQDSTEPDQDSTEPDQDSPELDQGLPELDQDLPMLDQGSPEPEFRGHRLSSPLSQYELEPGETVEIEIIYEATSEEGDIIPLEGQRLEIMWTSALSDVPPDLVITSVGASEVITDATGRARFTVNGGEVYELVRISASDPQRPEVTAVAWDMIVRGDPIPELITDLNIELTYDEGSGRYQAETLHGAQVSLFEDLSCGDLDISALPEPLYALPELRPYQRLDHVFTIDELRPESSLSAVAVITNEELVPIAVGCADRVEASSGSTIALPLRDLPEMLRSSYHAVHRLNFLEASLAQGDLDPIQRSLKVVRIIGGSEESLTEIEYASFCAVASSDPLICYYIFNTIPSSVSGLGDALSPAAREAMLRIGAIVDLITTLAFKSELRLYPQPLLTDDIANVEHELNAVSFHRDIDCDAPCIEELTLAMMGFSTDISYSTPCLYKDHLPLGGLRA